MQSFVAMDVEDRHDAWMPQHRANLPFADELLGLLQVFGVALSQHLDGGAAAVLAMHGSQHASESAGADDVRNLIIAVEVAFALALEHALDLVVGEQLAAR